MSWDFLPLPLTWVLAVFPFPHQATSRERTSSPTTDPLTKRKLDTPLSLSYFSTFGVDPPWCWRLGTVTTPHCEISPAHRVFHGSERLYHPDQHSPSWKHYLLTEKRDPIMYQSFSYTRSTYISLHPKGNLFLYSPAFPLETVSLQADLYALLHVHFSFQ